MLWDDRRVDTIFNASKYELVFEAFQEGMNHREIASRFHLSIDQVLDLYLLWKSQTEKNKTDDPK